MVALELEAAHDEQFILRLERQDGQERGQRGEERAPGHAHAMAAGKPEAHVIDGML
jgi:hypothetical protein